MKLFYFDKKYMSREKKGRSISSLLQHDLDSSEPRSLFYKGTVDTAIEPVNGYIQNLDKNIKKMDIEISFLDFYVQNLDIGIERFEKKKEEFSF